MLYIGFGFSFQVNTPKTFEKVVSHNVKLNNKRTIHSTPLYSDCIDNIFLAGKTTTDEELEEMLEHGNSAVFTQGVSIP